MGVFLMVFICCLVVCFWRMSWVRFLMLVVLLCVRCLVICRRKG